jgi:hypothetical protein
MALRTPNREHHDHSSGATSRAFQAALQAGTFRRRAIRLHSPNTERSITRHIDFVRNGAVHILDYKPDARTNKPIAQLTVYALALSRLTGIKLFDIKCAWFNENEYCEFFPRMLLSRGPGSIPYSVSSAVMSLWSSQTGTSTAIVVESFASRKR